MSESCLRRQSLQDEHATAVKEGHTIQAKAGEDIADLNSQLEQARSEYSAEREGRATDQQQAESTADELRATIRKLEDAVAQETTAREEDEREAKSRAEQLQRELETVQDGDFLQELPLPRKLRYS